MKTRSFTPLALLLLSLSISAEIKSPHIQSVLRGVKVQKCIDEVSKKHKVRFSLSPAMSFNDIEGPDVDYRGFSTRGVFPLPEAVKIDFTRDLLRSIAKTIADAGGEGSAVNFYSKLDAKVYGRQDLFRILYRKKNVQGIAMLTLSKGVGDNVNLAIHVYEHRNIAGAKKR